MAILALRKIGGGADFDRLTAVPEDVAVGKKFLELGVMRHKRGQCPFRAAHLLCCQQMVV